MPGVLTTGSVAFIGAVRFQGHWNPEHNQGTASIGGTKYLALMPTGTAGGGGYVASHGTKDLTASQGDYWQIIERNESTNISGTFDWYENDWIVYSGSGWMKLDYEDTLASIIVGDLTQTGSFHMGSKWFDTDVIFSKARDDSSVLSGSSLFQYNYTESILNLSGALNVSGSVTLGNAASNVITTTGQLTASQGAYFSRDVRIADDKQLYFGNLQETSIEYDENGENGLIISGSSQGTTSTRAGITISGSTARISTVQSQLQFGDTNARIYDGAAGHGYLFLSASSLVRFEGTANLPDDTKLTFGSGNESYIEYDEAGDDFLVISGSSSGVQISGSLLRIHGDIEPESDSTYNLGSSAKRFANVYTGDLHLRNERGDWTIVEEREYLCVVNNITGKKYKMVLQEIEE